MDDIDYPHSNVWLKPTVNPVNPNCLLVKSRWGTKQTIHYIEEISTIVDYHQSSINHPLSTIVTKMDKNGWFIDKIPLKWMI